MAKILAVGVLLLCFSAAFGRKCNICASTVSLEDCDTKKTEGKCPSGFDYCATLSTKFKIANVETKVYGRSCSTKALCDDASTKLKACKDAGGECSFKCCEKDLCNGGNAVPVVSTFLMLTCALLTFFR